MLIKYCLHGVGSCSKAIQKFLLEYPMDYGNTTACGYKYIVMLVSVGLGMRPATAWEGLNEANGGYLVVKEDGTVVIYPVHGRDKFEEYLLNNIMFEIASTSRHNFGCVYERV